MALDAVEDPGSETARAERSRRLARFALASLRVLGVVLVGACAARLPFDAALLLAQFLLLAFVAHLLGVPFGETKLQLEAAAIFPAVLLTRSWTAGVVLAAASAVAARLVERRGRLEVADFDDVVEHAFSYAAACHFLVALAPAEPSIATKAFLFVGTLLVFFFARVVLGTVRATAEPLLPIASLVRPALFQFVALGLLSPIVALIVLVHPEHGFGATLLAFSSVALVSASLRNLASVRRRTAELARQNRELATLRKISALGTSATGDEEMLRKTFLVLRETLPVRAMAAVSYEDEADGHVAVALQGDVAIDREAFAAWLSRREDREGPLLSTPRAPSVAKGPKRDLALNVGFAYQVVFSLQTPELIAGVLVLESDDPALVEEASLQELSVLADHLALSLQDRSLRRQMQTVNDRLQSRAETLHRILEVSNELKSHLTLDRVLVNIVRAVSQSLGYNVVLLSLYDRVENVFERRAQVGLDGAWPELSKQKVPREEIARWFAERFRISKSYFVRHFERLESDELPILPRRDHAAASTWHPQNLFFVPLTSGDQLIGVLQIDDPKSGRVPRLEDIQAVEIFANQAVTAIQSARAYETTRLMSVRDSLTDAFNHRHFQETLYRELTRHERSGKTLALAMLDIDDFKRINDRHGHPVGDLILKGLVEELLGGVREMDTVARYGGEEFALILPETTPEQAFLVADRLRTRVASRLFNAPELSHPLSITISIGLASFPDDATTKRGLIERADQALYQAKRSGKNTVVASSALAEGAERVGREDEAGTAGRLEPPPDA